MSKDVYHLFPILHKMPESEIDYLGVMLQHNMAAVTSSFWAFNAAPVYLNYLLNSALIEPDYGYSDYSYFEKSKHCFKLTNRGVKLAERNFPVLITAHEERRLIAANFVEEVEASFRDVGLPTEKQNASYSDGMLNAVYRRVRLNQTGKFIDVLCINLDGEILKRLRLPNSIGNHSFGKSGFDTDNFLAAYVVSLAYNSYKDAGNELLNLGSV